jgi:hypothetical protein
MTQYTLVHQNVTPLINNATTDHDSYILELGQKLLADLLPDFIKFTMRESV